MSEQQEKTEEQQETIREAMRLLGRSRSPRKMDALAENRAKLSTEESRQKQSEAQKARRQREREALGIDTTPTEKRPPGRPRKEQSTDADAAPKRGRGRPRKETAQTPGAEG